VLTRSIFLAVLTAVAVGVSACDDQLTGAGPRPVALSLPQPITLAVGEQRQIQAYVVDARGRRVPGMDVSLWSPAREIATVGPTNVLTAASVGSLEILVSARGLRGVIPVTVVPRGGIEVAEFALQVGADHTQRLDNWALVPPVVAFTLRNAAGESLCGRMPVEVRVANPDLATATYPADGLNPCAIGLTPTRSGTTWLIARAGTLTDSARLVVAWSNWRAYLTSSPDPDGDWTVGSSHIFTATLFSGRSGSALPASEVRVGFFVHDRGDWDEMWTETGPEGVASLAVRPLNVTVSKSGGSYGPRDVTDSLLVTAHAEYPDGSISEIRSAHRVRPGPPDHIAVMQRPWAGNHRFVDCTWEAVADTAIKWFNPWHVTREYVCLDWVFVAVVDAMGNPTELLPSVTVRTESFGSQVNTFVPVTTIFQLSYDRNGECGTHRYYTETALWGRGVYVKAWTAPAELIASYPGMPSRTVTLVDRPIPPPMPDDWQDVRNTGCWW